MMAPLQDKVAIVAGATGGIGQATVARLAADGARVIAADLDADKLDALAAGNDMVNGVPTDVTQEDAVRALISGTVDSFGRLDILFNGAGIAGRNGRIEDLSLDDYHRVIAVNVTGVFLMMKHAIPVLRGQGGGVIVNAASTAGLQGSSGVLPIYCASKHAVVGLTRIAAAAHAREGLRINAICPGPIDTDMVTILEEGVADGDAARGHDMVEGRIPMGRYGRPEEVAALIAFLCRDDAQFINGSLYTIDGAMTPF